MKVAGPPVKGSVPNWAATSNVRTAFLSPFHIILVLLTEKILVTGGVALVGSKVVEEGVDIEVDLVNIRRGNEAVDVHGTVVAVPELPVTASDVDRSGGLANGVDVTLSGEPAINH